MGKIIETKINRWDGGMTSDSLNPAESVCSVVTGFDTTLPRKLVPYRSSEDGDSAASTSQKQNFVIALRTGTTYRLYSLGVVSGTGKAEVLMKSLSTGASTDLDDNGWDTPANNQSSAGATSFVLFVYYKKTGLIYGAKAGTHIWAFDPSSVAAWADTHQALTYTNIAQGLVHSKDDILYIPYDNKIAKNDNGSWTTAALTLPSHLYITSICEYGNYLAIGCTDLSGVGKSVVFLWDRDSSLATLSESTDFDEGVLKILEEIDGLLVGISLISGSATFKDKIIFRYLSGNKAVKFNEMIGTTGSLLLLNKQKINNRLHFMATITLNGTRRDGVFSMGRNSQSAPMTIIHERTPNNDTAFVNGVIKGFFYVGDFLFQSYVNESSNYALSKTDDQATYSATAIRETVIFNGDNSSVTKKLKGVTVMTEYLPAAGQIVLKYRKDKDTSFTTIFTEATDNSISHSAINIESSGANLPEFKEIQFRIESTGGAVVTGLKFKYEILEKDIY